MPSWRSETDVVVSLGLVLAHFCPQEYRTCHPCPIQHVFQLRTKPPQGFDGRFWERRPLAGGAG